MMYARPSFPPEGTCVGLSHAHEVLLRELGEDGGAGGAVDGEHVSEGGELVWREEARVEVEVLAEEVRVTSDVDDRDVLGERPRDPWLLEVRRGLLVAARNVAGSGCERLAFGVIGWRLLLGASRRCRRMSFVRGREGLRDPLRDWRRAPRRRERAAERPRLRRGPLLREGGASRAILWVRDEQQTEAGVSRERGFEEHDGEGHTRAR